MYISTRGQAYIDQEFQLLNNKSFAEIEKHTNLSRNTIAHIFMSGELTSLKTFADTNPDIVDRYSNYTLAEIIHMPITSIQDKHMQDFCKTLSILLQHAAHVCLKDLLNSEL